MAQCSESDYRLLPSFIVSTRSVLNPMNNDLKSFAHAIAFAFHPTDWSSRRIVSASNSRFIQHGLDKIQYPVLPSDIPTLEERLQIKINLFSFDDPFGYKRFAMYISKKSLSKWKSIYYMGWTIWLDQAHFASILRYYQVI